MRAATCFSGIGAPECAAPWLDWRWCAEIEPFPAAVHAHRFPGVVNLGDVLAPDFLDRAEQVDVLVGGPPCQSFSIAGLRGGLADPRGNLTLRWVQVIHAVRPRYAVTENVPGWLSSNDNAFGCFLAGLVGADDPVRTPDGRSWPDAGMAAGPLGRAAWRVLDAQHFGVPQRRRRVFVVFCPPDGGDPAAVLFERQGVHRHPSAGRKARKGIAGALAASLGGCDENDAADGRLIAHALRGEGFDASADGTGRGTPLVPVGVYDTHPTLCREPGGPGSQDWQMHAAVLAPIRETMYGVSHADAAQTGPDQALRALREAVGEKAYSEWGAGVVAALRTQEVLRSGVHGEGVRRKVDQRPELGDDALSRPEGGSVWTVRTLWEAGGNGRPPSRWEPSEQLAQELGTYLSLLPHSRASASRFLLGLWRTSEGLGLLRQALSAVQEVWRSVDDQGEPAHSRWAVRRLTPTEAERLQGFPDDHTAITYRGKPAADGPRYKSLGNSMAVPVLAWLLDRVRADALRIRAAA
jgi:DNA (cytosine-5)-methyltransferase 1